MLCCSLCDSNAIYPVEWLVHLTSMHMAWVQFPEKLWNLLPINESKSPEDIKEDFSIRTPWKHDVQRELVRQDRSIRTPATYINGLGSFAFSNHCRRRFAEHSDLFREAILARNVYAAWARKLTNARPNDPKMQSYHQEVTLAGETVNSLLLKLNVPLFRIPASEKELDKFILRLKSRVNDPPVEKNEERKKPAVVSPPPPPHPVQRVGRRNEALMQTASLPQAAC
ncbi:hypothetical protein TNCV_3305991 [Trichonephila clavipes]|nr:hypothetical protein TNCV_3305991 [Trichonephila clavipes]